MGVALLGVVFAIVVLVCGASGARAATTETIVASPGPEIGATLTLTGASTADTITWETCDSSGSTLGGTTQLQTGTGDTVYTPTLADQGSYVCAVDNPGLLETDSGPVGPISGLADVPSVGPAGAIAQGQAVTLTQAPWGSDATVSDVWERCGASCTPLSPQPTGLTYMTTRADAGDVIEVVESASVTGHDGTPETGEASTAPTSVVTGTTPTEQSAPTISGTDVVGDALTASPGGWTNSPSAYTYQWERCGDGACTAIVGATSGSYTAVAADAGDSLEVLVTALVPGNASSAFPSAPTDPVTQPSSGGSGTTSGSSGSGGTPTSHDGTTKLGRLQSLLQWTFRYAPAFTQILQLEASEVPVDTRITIRCAGHGCPYAARRSEVKAVRHCHGHGSDSCSAPRRVDLQVPFRRRDLRTGARVTVMLSRAHEIGKYYRFTVRARREPSVRIACLAPGSSRPGHACTGV